MPSSLPLLESLGMATLFARNGETRSTEGFFSSLLLVEGQLLV